MARRRRSSGRGLRLDIDGLDEMLGAIKRSQRVLPQVYRDVLKGKGGEAIVDKAQSLTPRGRTGALANSIKITELPTTGWQSAGAVVIGPTGTHPKSSSRHGAAYDNATVGAWIESGAIPHEINPRARTTRGHNRRHGLRTRGGRFASHVMHPGFRGKRVMARTLRSVRPTVEAAVLHELEQRMPGSERG